MFRIGHHNTGGVRRRGVLGVGLAGQVVDCFKQSAASSRNVRRDDVRRGPRGGEHSLQSLANSLLAVAGADVKDKLRWQAVMRGGCVLSR